MYFNFSITDDGVFIDGSEGTIEDFARASMTTVAYTPDIMKLFLACVVAGCYELNMLGDAAYDDWMAKLDDITELDFVENVYELIVEKQ